VYFVRLITFAVWGIVILGAQQQTVPDAPKPEELCAIEGKVVNATTGEPVRKANLLLQQAERTPTGYQPPYVTTSDAEGRFSMKDLEPGRYRLSAMRTGFVRVEYGAKVPGRVGTTITLIQSQKLTSVDLRMTPQSVIAGRVLDTDEEPIALAYVQAVRWRHDNARRVLTPFGSSMTNDLGEFRIFDLAPGRYFLQVTYNSRVGEDAVDGSGRGGDEGYVPTYYPGTTDPAAAAPVEVVAGQQMTGVELRLSMARTLRIRGRVSNLTGIAMRYPISVMAAVQGSFSYEMGKRTAAPMPQGRFEFRGLRPGTYKIQALLPDGQTFHTGSQTVELVDTNVDNVVVTVASGITVNGEVKVEGADAATVRLEDLQVSLRALEMSAAMFTPHASDRVKQDGTFALRNVILDRLQFGVFGMPEGYYLKSVRMGEHDGLNDAFDFSSGAAGVIRATIAPGAALIEGSVSNDKQEPSPGVMVIVLPENETRRRQFQYVKAIATDQHGRFRFRGLDPGDYRIYALEDVEGGVWMDPEFAKTYAGKEKKLTLREGARETLELRVTQM
jgi:protocatechuate 3,4-dioxygenase beta subunit